MMRLKIAERLVLIILLIEWLIYFFSGVTFSALYGNNFYDIKVDIFYWIPFLIGIPQWILQIHWVGIVLDICIFICLVYQIYYPVKTTAARILFVLLFLFYIILTAYLTHRNYPTGIFIILIPFLFSKPINRKFAFEAIRYYLLWFYLSAASLKIFSGSVFHPDHFSHFLKHQFTPYFIENNTGWRTSMNEYLVHHIYFAYALFMASFFIELAVIIGFFTKRYDRFLLVMLILFHIADWILMDIAFIGQAAFISILFISSAYHKNGHNYLSGLVKKP